MVGSRFQESTYGLEDAITRCCWILVRVGKQDCKPSAEMFLVWLTSLETFLSRSKEVWLNSLLAVYADSGHTGRAAEVSV